MSGQNLGVIYYTVEARTAALLSAEKEVTQSMGSMTREMQGAERQAASLSSGMSKLASAIKVVVAASALREMAGLVQSYQEMSERVQMATSSQSEFEMVQRRLLDTANGTYRSLEEAQELYIRTADSLRSMGYSTAEALDITDSMSYAFVTNATSADRAAAATSAFSKSMNTGKVAADQWETITSAIPSVIQAIADASGKSAAEVRALGAAGKLSARDLSEGLRKSLDEVSAAAAKMANNLTDAGVRSATALTAVLVALEDQTGALQAFTDGIIAAADAVLAFSEDAEKMEGFLQLATVAGASLAAIVAGRMVSAMGGYAAAQVGAIRATQQRLLQEKNLAIAAQQRLLQEKNLAVEAHRRAVQEQAAAQRALSMASNETLRARAITQLAAANQQLIATETAKTVATTAHTASVAKATTATAAYSRATTAAGIAVRGLSAVMALIGGWPGLILLVGAAFLTMGRNAKMASSDIQELIGSIEKLGTRTLEFRRIELEKALADQEKAAARAAKVFEQVSAEVYHGARGQEIMASRTAKAGKDLEEASGKAQEYRDALAAVNTELERRASGADVGPQTPPGWTPPNDSGNGQVESQAQKRLQAMRDEIELAKRVGVAREQLRAMQSLGSEATPEEEKEAARLATQLYQLEEAYKVAQKAREDADKASKEAADGVKANADTIAQLEEQMRQAEMTAGELAARQAELSLNEYATPEQIRRVKDLGDALRENAELARMEQMEKDAIAADPRTASANQYEQQLEDYRAYREAELLTDEQYNELKNAAATKYEQDRLAAQEEIFRAQSAGNEFLMSSIDALGQASTDVLSGILSGTMNSKEAMQALGQTIFREAIGALVQMGIEHVKAIAMGQAAQATATTASVTQAGIQLAAWTPTAFAASIASFGGAAVAGIAAIGSTLLAGGRQYGGPVAAGSMYRINENGAPEVFNAANGRQYMMPNTRGEVVSNKDAAGATSGGAHVIQIINNGPPMNVRQELDGNQIRYILDLAEDRVARSVMEDGKAGKAMMAGYGLRRRGK